MQVILDNIIFARQHHGGISVVWKELLSRILSDSRFTCTFLDYPADNACRRELNLPSERTQLQVLRPLEPYRSPRMPKWNTAEACVFHSSYFRVSNLAGIRNITTVHDLTYHFYRHGAAKAVHLMQEEWALRHSSGVICVSEHTRQDLLHFYPWLQEDCVKVVYNGVNSAFAPDAQYTRQGYLLFVGNRQVKYKQFAIAVQVAKMTGVELVAIGSPATPAEQQELTQQLGADRFKMIHGVSNTALNRYYNEALCLLYPSDYEGFGIPVVEAQAAGCPVIAQEVSSIPEVGGDAALLVPHRDAKQVAADMADLVRQIQQGTISTSSLRQKGFANASRFSWDTCYEQTSAFYQHIGQV